jgi:hypothetical protein
MVRDMKCLALQTRGLVSQSAEAEPAMFNGYADQVAGLYKGLEGEKLYM